MATIPATSSRRRSLASAAPGAPATSPNDRADVAQVVGRGERPGDRFERRRAGLEPVVGRPDLERRQAIEDLGLPVQRAEMRPEPLVGRADEEVRVERLDVDRAVRRERDRVDVGQRADLVRARDDLGDRVDRPDRVAGIADRDELRRGRSASTRGPRDPASRRPCRTSTLRTVTPRSAAIASQVLTFASWSRVVTTISSPGPSVAPMDRPMCSVSVRHVVAELDLVRRRRAEEVGDRRVGLVRRWRRSARWS